MNIRIFTILLTIFLASCGGKSTFHEYARAGDTVAIPVGMQPDFSKDNITVTITPSAGADIVITATDPAIRGLINLYPDPASNMLVSRAIGEDTSTFASTYAASLAISSNFDKDWFQTTVFLDLPSTLPTGLTQIVVSNDLGTSHTATLDIIPGTGVANQFDSDFNGGLLISAPMFDSLARATHKTVTIDSTNGIPHAVEITLTHDPDITQGGTGKAFVINPLGYLKNISWSDDGTNLKLIIMQSKDGVIDNLKDYKFYIAGTVTNIALNTVKGYDINGQEISGVSAIINN